jgi:hypothetical protein
MRNEGSRHRVFCRKVKAAEVTGVPRRWVSEAAQRDLSPGVKESWALGLSVMTVLDAALLLSMRR